MPRWFNLIGLVWHCSGGKITCRLGDLDRFLLDRAVLFGPRPKDWFLMCWPLTLNVEFLRIGRGVVLFGDHAACWNL
ncbi:MAG: hypothetical protein CBB71_13295 [Rhodopirellula sp. TMED11]|nr:MAG: hypothetical protein CBB71_13295 [Rhodopirellula sp. TMED11]